MTHIQLHLTVCKPADHGISGRRHIATTIDNYELHGVFKFLFNRRKTIFKMLMIQLSAMI